MLSVHDDDRVVLGLFQIRLNGVLNFKIEIEILKSHLKWFDPSKLCDIVHIDKVIDHVARLLAQQVQRVDERRVGLERHNVEIAFGEECQPFGVGEEHA